MSLLHQFNFILHPSGLPGLGTGALVYWLMRRAQSLVQPCQLEKRIIGTFPAHRSLSDFRAFHLKELSDLLVQVVRLAREMGLVKLGAIAVDGTKIKANASRHKAMSYERMLKAEAELKAQIKALLDRAKAADEAEKNEPELDIPAELASGRRGPSCACRRVPVENPLLPKVWPSAS